MLIKCKMCGGDIEFTPGATYGTCEYCGSTSTIPKADDESKLNRYNRANHFRRQCEFDKAVAAYEKILEQDDTDAEAHWGAVISRYGIEYVEDPATGRRIPTCHRVQLTSILADEDYKAAVEYAPDAESRCLYEEEAARIAEIQKGILAVSQNEKPYDVFICYKETDESGQRTHDSQWAQEVYYGLTEQGYKVFFSRITLEDKLGQEYEPYIFAALQSARVMVVIGSKPEYFNAVWVKNEWSRYLALMAKDRKRLLIPCYRGMDPYDLPDELSSLQSQDMSKIGFMQDLIRGIQKVLEADRKPEAPRVVQQVVQTAPADSLAPGVASLMKRARLFLEDGDFTSASEYIDRVLDIDPEHAEAYAAKVCVTLGLRKEASLAESPFQFEDNPDWQKALRFANAQQKAVYQGYASQVRERVQQQIHLYAMDCATEMAVNPDAKREQLDAELSAYKAACTRSIGQRANGQRRKDGQQDETAFRLAVSSMEPGDVPEANLKAAAAMFRTIGGEDAADNAKACLDLAEQARQKAIYQSAKRYREQHRFAEVADLEKTAGFFLQVPDYKDAKAQAQKCLDEAEEVRAGHYREALKAMNSAGADSVKWDTARKKLSLKELDNYQDVPQLRARAERTWKECVEAEKRAQQQAEELKLRQEAAARAKSRRHKILAFVMLALAVAGYFAVTKVILPKGHYDKGVALRTSQQWGAAVAEFQAAGDYQDAKTQITETRYQEARALQKAGKFEEAITAFQSLGNYGDAKSKINECETGIKERDYQAAKALQQAGKYEEAIAAYKALGNYSNAKSKIAECETVIKEKDYQAAKALQQAGKYEEAIAAYKALGNYSDAKSKIAECETVIKERDYQAAKALQQAGRYNEAITAFTALGSYSDATAQIEETKYLQAKALTAVGDYVGAASIFSEIKGYKDVDSLLKNVNNLKAAAAAATREKLLKSCKTVGSYVTFGTYPQTNSGNDQTPIEWLVLDYDAKNNRALLLSRYGLDAKPYNTSYTDITWEKCTLRTWLNKDFVNKAFTSAQQAAILTTTVANRINQGYSSWRTNGGNNTQDKIFLLSYAEANKYLNVTYNDSKNTKSRVAPTAYAKKVGAWTLSSNKTADGSASGWWWLRSPGNFQYYAADVFYDGSLAYNSVSDTHACIRPAFWLNLNADIF